MEKNPEHTKQLRIICSHDSGNCCPVVEFQEQEVFIRDDYGGEVRLTPKQFDLLVAVRREQIEPS